MKVVGIVCEYNPFHNGHKKLIEYAKTTLGADYIIGVMSGNFTQRGEPAIIDKYSRAKMALINGIDIIYEIPTLFACSSAKEYATCAVKMLAKTGVVDTIVFGCETSDANQFITYAKKLIELEQDDDFNNAIIKYTKEGLSYPVARSKALDTYIDSSFISSPNNILGLEYTMAILSNSYDIKIATIQRDSNYNSLEMEGVSSSASSIRNAISNNLSFTNTMPTNAYDILDNCISSNAYILPNDLSGILSYKLLSENSFTEYLDIDNDLSNKICNSLASFNGFNAFANELKSKNLTLTKIQRGLIHILLGITTDDFEKAKSLDYITYLRMLGFSKNGSQLLSLIKENAEVPIITSLASRDSSAEAINLLLDLDIYASDIYRSIITNKTGQTLPTEYTKKYELCNL